MWVRVSVVSFQNFAVPSSHYSSATYCIVYMFNGDEFTEDLCKIAEFTGTYSPLFSLLRCKNFEYILSFQWVFFVLRHLSIRLAILCIGSSGLWFFYICVYTFSQKSAVRMPRVFWVIIFYKKNRRINSDCTHQFASISSIIENWKRKIKMIIISVQRHMHYRINDTQYSYINHIIFILSQLEWKTQNVFFWFSIFSLSVSFHSIFGIQRLIRSLNDKLLYKNQIYHVRSSSTPFTFISSCIWCW